MALFPYTVPLPVSGNNPSADQPNMTQNNNSINGIIAADHIGFNLANGGLHNQSTYVDSILALGTPITIGSGQVAFYGKTNGQSQVMATSDTGANEYQMTRFIDASFSTFGTFTNSGTVSGSYTQKAGWVFLPGNLLYQYAQVRRAAGISPSTITITYPVAFTTSNVIVSLTPICNSSGTSAVHLPSIVDTTVSSTGFTVNWDSSTSGYVGFTWTAIGN